MGILDVKIVQDYIRMCTDGWKQGWHERNGGNQKGRAGQIIRGRTDKPQKVDRIVGAPLQGLNKNQPDLCRRQAHCFAILREHTNSFYTKRGWRA